MQLQWLAFNVRLDRMHAHLQANCSSNYDGMVCSPDSLLVIFTESPSQGDQDVVNTYWSARTEQGEATLSQEDIQASIELIVRNARTFGSTLVDKYAAQNVLLGITQAGMTGTVRKRLTEVSSALASGSLYDAIVEIRAIPAEHKDTTFITDARLLAILNDIEDYLGITRSTSL